MIEVKVERRNGCASLVRVWTRLDECKRVPLTTLPGHLWQSVIEDRQWELPYLVPLVLCALFPDDTPCDRHSHLVYQVSIHIQPRQYIEV